MFTKTGIEGLLIYEPRIFGDERGYFFESFNAEIFKNQGIETAFVQDNQSRSTHGVLRGLHYQLPPFAQSKLVRCTHGEVLDVVVDIREGSKTYGKTFSLLLSAENKKQLFIPRGFAHGFAVMSDVAEFFYKCDNYYAKNHEAGIAYNDPNLNIDWQLHASEIKLSNKDLILPHFGNHAKFNQILATI